MTEMTRAGIALFSLLSLLAGAGCGIGEAQTQLRSAVDEKGSKLDSCYEAALTRNRDATGTLQANLYVDNAEGRITEVEFTGGDVRDEALETCMAEALVEVQVEPPPPANLKVEYTFHLTPRN